LVLTVLQQPHLPDHPPGPRPVGAQPQIQGLARLVGVEGVLATAPGKVTALAAVAVAVGGLPPCGCPVSLPKAPPALDPAALPVRTFFRA
jgi:hypothetical protein